MDPVHSSPNGRPPGGGGRTGRCGSGGSPTGPSWPGRRGTPDPCDGPGEPGRESPEKLDEEVGHDEADLDDV